MKENLRVQLFREIESLDQDHDDITILMSNMSLAEDNTDAGPSSHEGTPALGDTLSDMSSTVDSLSELITEFEEAVENDHKYDSCEMPVKNVGKHISMNRCKSLQFPYTNKIAKKSIE